MIAALYELLTGRPYYTVRSATAEFGPTPGAVFADQLDAYADVDLISHGSEILAELRTQARRTEVAR